MPVTTFIVIAVLTVTELLQAAAVGLLLRRLTRRMAVLSASIGVDHLTGLPGAVGYPASAHRARVTEAVVLRPLRRARRAMSMA